MEINKSRACIFIDGENFRYSIVDLFAETFDKRGYLPKEGADWTGFLDWIIEKAIGDANRVRAYWYVVETIDFYPYLTGGIEKDFRALEKVLTKNKIYRDELNNEKDLVKKKSAC